MKVRTAEVLIAEDGERRGRVCARSEGLYQFVTERLTVATENALPYWLNEYPPSGIYDQQNDAAAALRATLGPSSCIELVEPGEFDLDIGPYPPLG